MTTTTPTAPELERDRLESEAWSTPAPGPTDAPSERPDGHSIDATQGRQIGSHPYDDATQGRQIGSGPYDDATQGR